jgi:hypothetical protein
MSENASHKNHEKILNLHRLLDEDVLWVSQIWNSYNQLFEHGRERRKLLELCSSRFFKMNAYLITEATIMALSRLTDPETSMGKKNLTLHRILPLLQEIGSQDLIEELKPLLKDLEKIMGLLHPYRIKRYAHYDYDLAIKEYELPGLVKVNIDQAIYLIQNIMNAVQGKFNKSITKYDYFWLGDVSDLINILERSYP